MKSLFLLFLLISGLAVQAQEEKPKLKDLLYGGKLKKDSSGVIRKTDDLSSKIDTGTKKETVAEIASPASPVIKDTVKKLAVAAPYDTSAFVSQTATANTTVNTNTGAETVNTGVAETAVVAAPAATPPKSNTKLWKEYTDSLTSYLKTEALSSKQIKKETYYMSFDYEIGLDGLVTVSTVSSTPSNNFLLAQVKQFLDNTPFHLNPVLDSNGQPRKVKRKQGYTVTKD